MKLPLSWLSDYTKISAVGREYAHALTMTGSKVETCEMIGGEIEKVVVGKILKIDRHPDADKLVVCHVNVGDNDVQIVTGATNVFEGAYVPVALHKSHLPGGVTITKGKLRGVVSEGMMCSTDELGMTDGVATGILILEGEPQPGTDIKAVLGLDEYVADFEITSNRPDCLSVIGLARESAATYGADFSIPEIKVAENNENISDYVSVEVKDSELCPRYTARVVKNIKIEPSPMWLQRRLEACGVRAINNIVDITNYVMLEYGQPMHAFDLNFLNGSKIVVRRAEEGESITTLDGEDRKLSADMLVICDSEKPVAVAGVMGGENSEIKDDTKTIVFESANFKGSSVRLTAKALGMRTESSGRFEKGLDPYMTVDAVNRACQLICELGAGEVVGGIIDVCGELSKPVKIKLRPDKINSFLGIDIPKERMVDILEKIGFTVDGDTVTSPSFRTDIECEADVAEEIARFYGYDVIESTLMKGESTAGGKTPSQMLEDKIRASLTAQGLYEIYTYSFVDPATLDKLNIPSDDKLRSAVMISNPLGEEQSMMRTTPLGEMLKALSLNHSHRNADVALFEIANTYLPKSLPVTELPDERNVITCGMYGNLDFYDLKGIVEQLLDSCNVKKYSFKTKTDNPSFHPGKTAALIIGGKECGCLGQVHPSVADNFELSMPTFAALIDFNAVLENAGGAKSYKHLPKFPAVTRDIAMLCDDETEVGSIEEIIRKSAGNLLEELNLFDVYKGKQIPEGKKSVAYSIVLRSADKTLEEAEVTAVMNSVVSGLESKLGAELRKN